MKHLFNILILLMLSTMAMAQSDVEDSTMKDNDFIYERYAPRTDLTVAQLLDYPVDSNLFVNIVMLQADSDEAWERLKIEFAERNYVEHPRKRDKRSCCEESPIEVTFHFRNHNDPTIVAMPPSRGDLYNLNSCLVAMIYPMQSVWLFYYNTHAEANRIIDWLLQEDFSEEYF